MRACGPFVLLTLLLSGRFMVGTACSCLPPPPPCDSLMDANTKSVFKGKVTNVYQEPPPTPAPVDDPSGETAPVMQYVHHSPYNFNPKIVTFEVLERWKGATTDSFNITTGPDDGMCGIGFGVGETWLVYTYGGGEGLEGAGTCSRTRRWDEDEGEELDALIKEFSEDPDATCPPDPSQVVAVAYYPQPVAEVEEPTTMTTTAAKGVTAAEPDSEATPKSTKTTDSGSTSTAPENPVVPNKLRGRPMDGMGAESIRDARKRICKMLHEALEEANDGRKCAMSFAKIAKDMMTKSDGDDGKEDLRKFTEARADCIKKKEQAMAKLMPILGQIDFDRDSCGSYLS